MNIVVNGGTRGIGKEIALIFALDKSNKVFVTGRNISALKQLSARAEHGNIFTYAIDIADFDNQETAFLEEINRHFKSINILINCAGLLVSRDFMEFNNSEARNMMEANFFGPASVIRKLVSFMSRGSHIVNISSMGGYQGSSKYRGLSYYSASKAALSCLSECLAGEFSSSGIAVNCLALGAVQTEMFKEAFPGQKAPVSPIEMAEFIVYFAKNGNKYFNGKVIPVAVNDP
jgi:NAD(P)-dependent dehydrogenase (short-subunit alcohol dehydrogenase family)